MTQTQGVAVTYTGRDDPFKDRLYRSGLTFTPGQTRIVPLTLAERFLRHQDVFTRAKTAEELQAEALAALDAAQSAQAASDALKQQGADADPAAQAEAAKAAELAATNADAAQREADDAEAQLGDKKADDTQALLSEAKKDQDTQRVNEEARFALLDQLDRMDKTALINWAQDHYKQKIPGNLGPEKVRERAKGFVDQYGMP